MITAAQPSVILIAEDDPFDVLLLQNALSAAGLDNPVRVFENGAELLAYLDPAPALRLQREAPLPKILFLDLRMPLVDGFDVIAEIRRHARWASLRIVVVSGTPDPGDASRALELGADDFVLKPIAQPELERVLTAAWTSGVG
jgi:CheY-like chemotaxis protein